MRELKTNTLGVNVWSNLVMKDGKWIRLERKTNKNRNPVVSPRLREINRMASMIVFAKEEDRLLPLLDQSQHSSPELPNHDKLDEMHNGHESPVSAGENQSNNAQQNSPKKFVSGYKKINWPPHILRLERKAQEERKAKEKEAEKLLRKTPKYKEIEHNSVKINRQAEIARRKLILKDKIQERENLMKKYAELESRLKKIQAMKPAPNDTTKVAAAEGFTSSVEENPITNNPDVPI